MMQMWLPLAVFAYLLFAFSGILDKIIIGRKITNPAVVSFWVAAFGVLSASIILPGFLPLPIADNFAFSFPSLKLTLIILAAGALQQFGLYCMYRALQRDEATRVVSVIGASNPIFSLVLAYVILGESLRPIYYVAFALLLAGAIVISIHRKKLFGPSFQFALASAAVLALQTVLTKLVFNAHPFVSSFALLSIGGGLYALGLVLFVPSVKQEVLKIFGRPLKRAQRGPRTPLHWVILNSAAGGIGVLCLNIALVSGPVSLINALRGVQYAGVFLIALVLSKVVPKLLKEELSLHTLEQKMISIGLIAAGIGILVIP